MAAIDQYNIRSPDTEPLRAHSSINCARAIIEYLIKITL